MKKFCGWIWLISLLVLHSAQAQTTGTISGIVRDPSHAVVPGASVVVRNVEVGNTRTLTTDAQGRYQAPNLAVGQYEVEVSAQGFQSEVRRNVELSVAREVTLNFEISVGQVAERVEAIAEPPVVETNNATITGLVDQNTIRDLPLNGRSFTEMLTLQVGTVLGRADRGADLGGGDALGGGPKVSVSGARPGQNSYLLDGTDINDSRSAAPGGSSGLTLGVETVREFRVLTNSYSAEYGRSSGGVLTAVTKSGTNEFHATLFEFLRNSKLDANTWESTARANGFKAPFKRNQFGFTAGGPVRREHTFFFGSYEALRDRLGSTPTIQVPTARARAGFLPQGGSIGQPEVFVGVIPAARPWLEFYPLTNGPQLDLGNGTGDYSYTASQPTNQSYYSGRVDHKLTDDHSMFARYTIDDSNRLSASRPLPDRQKYTSRNQYLTAQFDSIITTATLNTARFGMNRSRALEVILYDDSFDVNSMTFVPGVPFDRGGALVITGIAGIGNVRLPRGTFWRMYEGSDDLTLVRGGHSLKLGANYKRVMDNEVASTTEAGSYTHPDGVWGFVQGRPDQFQLEWKGLTEDRDWRQGFVGLYAQDDFRIRPNLTVNLGVRLEYVTSPGEAKDRCSNITDFTRSTPDVGCPFIDTVKNNWAPRVGFAWDTRSDSKVVLRGGFGLFYDQPFSTYWRPAGRSVPPFAISAVISRPRFPDQASLLDFTRPPSADIASTEIRSLNYTGTTYVMQYNFNVQSELRPGTGITVGYLGSQGRKLVLTRSMDTIPRDQQPDGRLKFRNAVSPENPDWSSFLMGSTEGNSGYNALVLSLNQHFRGGLRIQVSYTWSKTMSISDTVFGADFNAGDATTGVMDAYDLARDRGPATYSLKHNLTANYSYDLPFKVSGWSGKLVEGWQLNGIISRQSGVPFSLTTAFRPDHANAVVRYGQLRLDLPSGNDSNPIKGATAGCGTGTRSVATGRALGNPDLYYDPCVFSNPERGYFGTLGRNTLTGPGLVNLDFSLTKNTRLTERSTLQFRAEYFNVFNHPNFRNPVAAVFDTQGRLGANVGRVASTTTRPRQIQLGLKLIF